MRYRAGPQESKTRNISRGVEVPGWDPGGKTSDVFLRGEVPGWIAVKQTRFFEGGPTKSKRCKSEAREVGGGRWSDFLGKCGRGNGRGRW